LPVQITPAITPGHTVIVLIQNGLNIEKPFFQMLPNNIVLSGVSMIGSHEVAHGAIEHEFPDKLIIGAFRNPNLDPAAEDAAAKRFVEMYSAAGKTACTYDENVGFVRWRKLVYNACLNPICAITNLDTGRIRLADDSVDMLVRPAMEEIRAAAKAMGHDIPEDVVDYTIEVDPLRLYLPPSMLADMRKVCFLLPWSVDTHEVELTGQGNFIEYENLVGEPLREGLAKGVPMPTLKVLYALCKASQWRTKEEKGIFVLPPKEEPTSTS
jgi:2-dehydropantoate 2-reductase